MTQQNEEDVVESSEDEESEDGSPKRNPFNQEEYSES